jgi:GT2 family glycosyltransferase
MVMERSLFERMGGFNVDFIFGHYEDADLCLRIQESGGRVILDPGLAYWHYEGMGSTKRPEHVGSNMYNRWYFSRLWGHRLTEQDHV